MKNIDAEIQKIYERMVPDIQKEIESFYQRYADKEGISLAEAKKRVSKFDVKAFEARAAKMVKERDFSAEANELMRLYNATMRINRLELLKADIGLHMIDGFDDLEKLTGEKLTEEAVKEFERQAGILGNGVKGASERAKSLVGQSFMNATFSERIWSNQEALRNKLSTILTKGLIGGKSYQSLAAEIRKDFNVSAREAMRLVRTEMVRVQTQAQIDSYKANGWEEFEFLAYGTASCEICNALNKKHFKISDFQPAENAPPMHPNCRCRTAPYEDEEEYQKWLDSFGDNSVKFAKDDILKDTDRVYTKSEIEQIAQRTFELVNKYVDNESKWSGRIIVDDSFGRCAKLWNCDIVTTSKTSPHMILHEQIHAHSISYYDVDTYRENHKIEEASVQLLAQEISKREGIEIIHSQYDEMVSDLRAIRKKMKVFDSDLEFAKMLIKIPVVDRIGWLEEQAYNQMLKNGTIKELEEINSLIERVQ